MCAAPSEPFRGGPTVDAALVIEDGVDAADRFQGEW